MPRVITAFLARDVLVDRQSNHVTAYSILEEIAVPQDAFTTSDNERSIANGDFVLFALISWEWPVDEPPSPLKLSAKIRTAGGNESPLAELEINQKGDLRRRSRAILRSEGLLIDQPGIYVFEIRLNGELAAEVPLRVSALKTGSKAVESAPADS